MILTKRGKRVLILIWITGLILFYFFFPIFPSYL